MTGNDPTTPKPAPMLTNSMTEDPMTNEPKPLDLPPMPNEALYLKDASYICDLEIWGRQIAEIAQAQARRADEAEATIAKYAADDVRYLGVLAAKGAERAALKARVAELEKRETNDYDCRMVGRLAEMGGSHCPPGNPCQRCQLEDAETALAQRDREVLALREALGGTVKEMEEVIKSAEREAVHFDGDEFHERLTAGFKALASTAQSAILGTESEEAQP